MNPLLSINHQIANGTYEAIGKHFRDNPYHLNCDTLIKHGEDIIEVERSFDGIKKYLKEHDMEGIVFWKDGEPKCKIKRSDFGFPWNSEKLKTKIIISTILKSWNFFYLFFIFLTSFPKSEPYYDQKPRKRGFLYESYVAISG